MKNTTGPIGRFVWEVKNRKGGERCCPAVVGVEEPEPGYQAELSVHIFQYLNTRGLLTVNANKAARQDPAAVISEVRGLQMHISKSGKLFSSIHFVF